MINKRFPKLCRFKACILKRKRARLQNIAHIIEISNTINEFNYKLTQISARDIERIQSRTIGQSSTSDWYFLPQRSYNWNVDEEGCNCS